MSNEDKVASIGLCAGVIFVAIWLPLWLAIIPYPRNHYPKLIAVVEKIVPQSDGTQRALLGFTHHGHMQQVELRMPWTTYVGERDQVILGPDKAYVPNALHNSEEENPNQPERHVLNRTMVIVTIFFAPLVGWLVGWLAFAKSWSISVPKLNRKPLLLVRNKAKRNLLKLDKELAKAESTPKVIKTREQIQTLLQRMDEKDDPKALSKGARIDVIADTVNHLFEDYS